MSDVISAASIALKQAIYIGNDRDLQEAVRVSIMSKYAVDGMEEVPHIWPEQTDLVFLEYDGHATEVLENVSRVLTLSKGIPIYVLLKQKDVDFVIEANHQGVQGFIECPNEVFHILSILHMQDRRKIGKNGNVSTFFSLKGGVGCTALATNISSHLNHLTEGRTVLVDLNMPLGDTTLYLSMDDQRLYTLMDFVYNINRFDENLIYKSLSKHSSGLYLLALPSEIGELDNLNGELIKTIIRSLRKYFDHVVIDCSSDLSEVTMSCLDESDNIVLVSEPSLSSLRSVNAMIKLTQRLGYLKESLKLIVNRQASGEDEMVNEVINALGVDSVVKVKNDYWLFNESLKAGHLLKEHSPDAPVNQQLEDIAKMLHTGSFQVVRTQKVKEKMDWKQALLNRFRSSSKTSSKKLQDNKLATARG